MGIKFSIKGIVTFNRSNKIQVIFITSYDVRTPNMVVPLLTVTSVVIL